MHEGWKINYDCEEYKLIKYKKQQHHHKTEAARECQTERGSQRREQEEGGIETVRKAQKHSTNATESQSGNGQTRNSTRAGPRRDGRQPRAANKQGGEGGGGEGGRGKGGRGAALAAARIHSNSELIMGNSTGEQFI